jgi:hypothetical protein
MLTKIPEWSDVTLSTEVERIQKVTKCPYLDDLVMGVFISYMKAFASLHSGSNVSIEFDRPSLAKFIHELYIQSARKLWQVAYLFKTSGVSSESQARARHEIDSLINQCLEQVIRGFLPWESITRKYFTQPAPVTVPEPQPEEEPEAEEEKKAVSFGEDEEEEFEAESDEEEKPPVLQISEEEATLEVDEDDSDPLKDLEKKMEETLVLNL